jgi:hypothetical protein
MEFFGRQKNVLYWVGIEQRPYLQHFIFFVTFDLNQKATALYYTKPEGLASEKHSGLLEPFVSYVENEVLQIQSQVSY